MRRIVLTCTGVLALLVTACGEQLASSPPPPDPALVAKAEWEAKQAKEAAEELTRCSNEKAALLEKFDAEMKAKAFNKARLVVYRCSTLSTDTDFASRVQSAQQKLDEEEIRELVQKLTARHAPVSTTVAAYEKLLGFKNNPAFKLAEPHVTRYSKQYESDKKFDVALRQYDVAPQIGWSQTELIQQKGYPTRLNRSVSGRGVTEQFIYCRLNDSPCTYVYLSDGVVTSYQE